MYQAGQYLSEKETMKVQAEVGTHDSQVMNQTLGPREPTTVGIVTQGLTETKVIRGMHQRQHTEESNLAPPGRTKNLPKHK
jgi:hypothetical protein